MRSQFKRFWLAVLLIVAIGIAALAINPIGSKAEQSRSCGNHLTNAIEFRKFSESVWKLGPLGTTGATNKAIAAEHKKLKCAAGRGNRNAMLRTWRKDKKKFVRDQNLMKKLFINFTWPGATYPESAWFGLPELKPYVAAALAEAAGDYIGVDVPGWTMEQISQGEGDLKPGSRSTDDGYGWLAITAPYGSSFGVDELGGYDEMLNPVKNAYVAARMYAYGGIVPWHGTAYVTNSNLHYRGKFDITKALGGLTFGQALRASK